MATTKRNRRVLNIVMVMLAAVVVVAGVMFFMSVRGGQGTPSSFVVTSKIGNANIERAGINYALDEGTALQEGDIVEALGGSEVGVKGAGDTAAYLADASKMQVKATEATPSKAGLEIMSGCVFADAKSADEPLALEGAGQAWTASDAVYVSDVRTGSVAVQVLSGEVSFADGTVVRGGGSRTVLTDKAGDGAQGNDSINKLTLGSLDSFALDHALEAVEAGRELAFTKDEIDAEIERRENERLQQSRQADAADEPVGASEEADAGDAVAGGDIADSGAQGTSTGEGSSASGNAGTASSSAPSDSGKADEKHTCTIQIRCDTILKNMDDLAAGKSKYVPKNGSLLGSKTMTFTEGESAFDVLKRACSDSGIALEYSYAPVYGSYYVEGIGNLYQFDCGDESGWMYKVNGWFPNYGCSEYKLSDGDAIVFCYTCRGLGEDVGA